MNCADHCNRSKYLSSVISVNYVEKTLPFPDRVYGLLLGKQDGKTIEIINSFEVKLTVDTSKLAYKPDSLDPVFIDTRVTAYKKMFPNLDVVGWY